MTKLTDEQILENIGIAADLMRLDVELKDERAISFAFRSLSKEWNLGDDFIMKVAVHFESADEGELFLHHLDGADDIQEAWGWYCEERGIELEIPYNPFIEE